MENQIKGAAERWGLNRCEEIYLHPTKAVLSAEAERFGPVILKIDGNISRLKSEHRMLTGLSGRHSCRVYAYDENAGLLLEERIFPGTVLRREASLEKRIKIFSRIFREIHMPAGEGETFRNWQSGRGESARKCSGNIRTGYSSTVTCTMTTCCRETTAAMP